MCPLGGDQYLGSGGLREWGTQDGVFVPCSGEVSKIRGTEGIGRLGAGRGGKGNSEETDFARRGPGPLLGAPGGEKARSSQGSSRTGYVGAGAPLLILGSSLTHTSLVG